MTKSKAYLLENKGYEPIVEDIEKHPIGNTLRYHIAIFKWFEHQFIIVASNELVQAIAVKHGAIELAGNDGLRQVLRNDPDEYRLLYGEKVLAKFID
jgi:hypothetical protein